MDSPSITGIELSPAIDTIRRYGSRLGVKFRRIHHHTISQLVFKNVELCNPNQKTKEDEVDVVLFRQTWSWHPSKTGVAALWYHSEITIQQSNSIVRIHDKERSPRLLTKFSHDKGER